MEEVVIKIQPRRRYIREGALPTVFCSGCGGGTVLNLFTKAVEELEIDPKKIAAVTGIGCSSWVLSPYFKADTLHTTHGRAIACATGIKIVRPDLFVVVIAGDGDISGIGGNHLIHAARRNIDLKVIMINNHIYGMTGGQVAPVTPEGVKTTTTPYGNPEPPFNVAELVAVAGATYVARWTTLHVTQLIKAMKRALTKKGFSFIEVISPCTTSFAKAIGFKKPSDFLEYYRNNSVPISKASQLSEEELKGKIVVGTLVDKEKEEFIDKLIKIREKALETIRNG